MWTMQCQEKLNRFSGDIERCGKPVVAYVNTAVGKDIELCTNCAKKYIKNKSKVNYYI